MARRKNRKDAHPVGYVLIADGDTEQWYVELVKDYYGLKVKIQPELSCGSITDQYELVKESIAKGYEHVFWMIDFDCVLKENKETKSANSVLQSFKSCYQKAKSRKEWEDKLTIIVNNPCLEYWFYLHKNPHSTKYFGTYKELLPELRKFKIDDNLFGKYNKSKNDFKSCPNLFEKLLPYMQKIDHKLLKSFDIEACQQESVSEMPKLFETLEKGMHSGQKE